MKRIKRTSLRSTERKARKNINFIPKEELSSRDLNFTLDQSVSYIYDGKSKMAWNREGSEWGVR